MASRSVTVQWYQTGSTVTASVLIKEISSDEIVTARFESQRCAVYAGGEHVYDVYIPLYMTHNVVYVCSLEDPPYAPLPYAPLLIRKPVLGDGLGQLYCS